MLDRILRHGSIVPGLSSSLFRLHSPSYETYPPRSINWEYMCMRNLARQYLCRFSATICNDMGCNKYGYLAFQLTLIKIGSDIWDSYYLFGGPRKSQNVLDKSWIKSLLIIPVLSNSLVLICSGQHRAPCGSNERFHNPCLWPYYSLMSIPIIRPFWTECVHPNLYFSYSFFGKAVLSLCIGYGLNWLYFDVDNTGLKLHAIRRHVITSMIYSISHLPFIMVYHTPPLTSGNHARRCGTRISCHCAWLSRRKVRRFNPGIHYPLGVWNK
jgi:hypothetical protein